jgi:hypothetical protein
MSRNDFKARCFGRGIKLGKINKFVEGRYRFSSADITTLEEM